MHNNFFNGRNMPTRIDHLVIGAESLAQGVDYVRNCLGVSMPYGGVHEKMGTHNHLMQLGHDIFLEILAINDELEPPARPRWYSLDDAFVRQQIERQPALLTWVVNTRDITRLIEQATFALGKAEPVRRGHLSWHFGLPEDGRLIAGGMLPYAIEWHTDTHPSGGMADLDCRFQRLEIYHPYPRWLASALASIGASDLVTIKALSKNRTPYMIAYIDTPAGLKQLHSLSRG
jgi:hypothetical protein